LGDRLSVPALAKINPNIVFLIVFLRLFWDAIE
jgi:hypothetical protein